MSDETKPCPTCELPIKQGGHWNEILCLHALKNRVIALELRVHLGEQHRRLWLQDYLWDGRTTRRFNHLAQQLTFQFFVLRDHIEWMDGGDFDKVKQKATELFHTANELLKEVGL